MLLLGHIGITVGAVHFLNRQFRRQSSVDLRIVAVSSLLSDFIDKPFCLLFPIFFGNHSRIFGHSLLFSLIFLWIISCKRFRQYVGDPLLVWIAYVCHLFLDQMWGDNIHSLFWPVLGWPPPLEEEILKRWFETLLVPYNIFGEVAGLTILMILYFRYHLNQKNNWQKFCQTGLLEWY